MENQVWKKTPFVRLVIAATIGVGTSIAPLVLLMFGLIQFNIIRLVGPEKVTVVFGMAAGISSLAIVILGPLGGVIADRTHVKFGRRRFWMIAGSIGGAIAMFALTYASSVPILIGSWCIAQFFYGMVSLSCFAIVPEQVEAEKFGRVSGLIGASAPACVMIGQILIGVFSSSTVQQKLLAIIIVQLIGGIIAALIVKDNYFPKQDVKEKKISVIESFKGFYPSFNKHPEFTWALLTKLFINIANAGLTLLTLFYIARFHLGEAKIFQINALTAPSIMLMVVAGILGGFLSDKIRRQKVFVIAAALVTGVCLVAFAFSFNITWVIVANFIFNFGFGMYGAVDNAIVNRILPSKENAGKDISIMNVTTQLASSLVNFVAPMTIALGTKLLGGDGYTFFFLVLAAFSILSALMVIPIPEISKEKNNKKQVKIEISVTE
ncbi:MULTISPECIES: MFS transporter [Clostridium]|uniref:MFS transporter n=1 Tax=Clostridium frigoriphilum TaxID=443253 RepID=A0ABU7ULE0_9CLOT|nr:MFS transporter [Clostridium sp. DSM 17811]MBU3099494.1 MFS transporter [Clostridium sp. DSM 17811]